MAKEVLIVGAGFAGLAAALELHRAGAAVRILEARERLGGRAFTLHVPGLEAPIELGAEFIHGRPPEIFSIPAHADLKPIELGGDQWCAHKGRLQPCTFFEQVDSILSRLEDTSPDTSFLAYVRDHVETADPEDMQWAINYVRGFHAADPARISVHSIVHGEQADEQIEGERQYRPAHGYGKLVDWYSGELAGVPIDLNTVVRRVRWRAGGAEVTAIRQGHKETYSAAKVIITVPLGVLQAEPGAEGAITFEPRLPDLGRAAASLRMGHVIRVVLRFRERFWLYRKGTGPDLARMQFLFSRDEFFPTWWTMHPMESPVLVGWAPDRGADRLAGRPEADIIERALRTLERLLPLYAREVRSAFLAGYLHDWQSDPYARGAYSYVAAGGEWAQRALAEPIADTLFFAGEACDYAGHHSTVHGAIASGIRAAQSLKIVKAA